MVSSRRSHPRHHPTSATHLWDDGLQLRLVHPHHVLRVEHHHLAHVTLVQQPLHHALRNPTTPTTLCGRREWPKPLYKAAQPRAQCRSDGGASIIRGASSRAASGWAQRAGRTRLLLVVPIALQLLAHDLHHQPRRQPGALPPALGAAAARGQLRVALQPRLLGLELLWARACGSTGESGTHHDGCKTTRAALPWRPQQREEGSLPRPLPCA